MNTNIEKTLNLAENLARAGGFTGFVAVAEVTSSYQRSFEMSGQWAGVEVRYDDWEMLLAPTRILLPIWGNNLRFAHDWANGQPGYATRLGENVVGVAIGPKSLLQEAMISTLLCYSMEYEVRLHHGGIRFATEDETLRSAFNYDSGGMLVKPAADHLRIYFPVPNDGMPGRHYREFQSATPGATVPSRHLDVATHDPVGLLELVATACETEAEFWDPGPNDPVGAVWVTNSDGSEFGLMARGDWTAVESW